MTPRLLAFWAHHQAALGAGHASLTVRDLLAWASFIAAAAPGLGALPAYVHGAYLVVLDGLGLGLGLAPQVRTPGLQPVCNDAARTHGARWSWHVCDVWTGGGVQLVCGCAHASIAL